MKMLMVAVVMTLGIAAGSAQAEQMIRVDGEDYRLSDLTQNCQNITGDPAAQIACFAALSQLIAAQSEAPANNDEAIVAAFGSLQGAAQYQDEETGLIVRGTGCNIEMIYYGNYFHISRRNISQIDLFAVAFDAKQLPLNQIVPVQGSQVPMLRATMPFGVTGQVKGGVALESGGGSFEARAPGMPLADFTGAAVNALPATDSMAFDFVLVHPKRAQSAGEITTAFQEFVTACQS